jgi:hypothetical protein
MAVQLGEMAVMATVRWQRSTNRLCAEAGVVQNKCPHELAMHWDFCSCSCQQPLHLSMFSAGQRWLAGFVKPRRLITLGGAEINCMLKA